MLLPQARGGVSTSPKSVAGADQHDREFRAKNGLG
jgi:hypothetical protein